MESYQQAKFFVREKTQVQCEDPLQESKLPWLSIEEEYWDSKVNDCAAAGRYNDYSFSSQLWKTTEFSI